MASGIDLVGLDLESLDPTPDVHALFAHYNTLYFENQLGACSVEWSTKRMTLCAGVCHFSRTGGCRIKLSEPLLKFRPVRDLKDTLLHEMIHAALFLGNVRDDGDHGPKFRALMDRINRATCLDPQRPPGGYKITVYHTMHDEVNNYRTHVWRCIACGNMVRRSMNRPPQEADCRSYSKAAAAAAPGGAYCHDARCWYHGHVRTCGGQYEKIAEPEKPPAKAKPSSASSGDGASRHPNAPNKRRPTAGTAGAPAITSFFPKRDTTQQQQQQHEDCNQQQQQPDRSQVQGVQPTQQLQQQQQLLGSMMQGGVQQQQQGTGSSAEGPQAAKPPDPRTAAAAAALARALGSNAAFVGGTRERNLSQWVQGGRPLLQRELQNQQQHEGRLLQGQWQHSQQQQQQMPPAAAAAGAEVVDLVSSEEEGDQQEPIGPAGGWTGAGGGRNGGGAVAVSGATSHQVLLCPVCCAEFQELSLLNAHLDHCLL